MNVLYNATSARVGGGLSYAIQQLLGLAREGSTQITVLTAPWNDEPIRSAVQAHDTNLNIVSIRVRNAGHRFLWEQLILPRLARQHDVLLSPGNFTPLIMRTPGVMILQNPNYAGSGRFLPQNDPLRRKLKISLSHAGMRSSNIVVAISHSLDAAINGDEKLERVRPKVRVVRSGAPSMPKADINSLPQVLVETPYILSVANGYPHKRLEDLSQAFSRLAQDAKLVFVGDISLELRELILAKAGPRRGDVLFLGSVGDRAAISALYGSAGVAVSTSELEAFPLTLHEAGSLGCPLLLTDIPPHRELADERATFFKVGDVTSLTAAMETALSATVRPVAWSWPGTWDQHAAELLDVLREAAGE